jgi:hypothetical protein
VTFIGEGWVGWLVVVAVAPYHKTQGKAMR